MFLVLSALMGAAIFYMNKKALKGSVGYAGKAAEQKSEEISRVQNPLLGLKNIKNGIAEYDTHMCIYLRLGSIDFHLLTEGEQQSVEDVLLSLARTVNFPVQVVVISRQTDTRMAVNGVVQSLNINRLSPQLRSYAEQMVRYLSAMMENRGTPDYEKYLVIRCDMLDSADKTRNELYRRADLVISELARAKIPCQPVKTDEIPDIFFDQLNPQQTFKPSAAIRNGGLYYAKGGGIGAEKTA
ncbi:hypothetical protein [Thermincola ferriacetica]|nr:hypothetical protein [Thermincola ferriacetica]